MRNVGLVDLSVVNRGFSVRGAIQSRGSERGRSSADGITPPTFPTPPKNHNKIHGRNRLSLWFKTLRFKRKPSFLCVYFAGITVSV